MKINFDTKADIIRIKFQEGEYEISEEVKEGIVVDMAKDNTIMAIEILDVSEKMPKKNLKDITIGISD